MTKLYFQQPWLQSSVSHDPSEIILISWFGFQESFLIIRKAAGPDGITGCVLRFCAVQLAGLFTSIFNESLVTSVVPTSFKKSVIIHVPKNNKPSCLNDYRLVALTSTVMKVFERLVKNYICSSIPVTLDPPQFAQIDLLTMPSLTSCTRPSDTLTATMGTM